MHSEVAKRRRIAQTRALGYTQPATSNKKATSNSLSLLQYYVLNQLGCASQRTHKQMSFHKNELKKTAKGNHWGYVCVYVIAHYIYTQ